MLGRRMSFGAVPCPGRGSSRCVVVGRSLAWSLTVTSPCSWAGHFISKDPHLLCCETGILSFKAVVRIHERIESAQAGAQCKAEVEDIGTDGVTIIIIINFQSR